MMKKNTTISERILQMIESVDVTPNEFAKKLGYNRSQAIYDIINGKSKPSFDFFEKLQNSEYSELFNLNWVISGGGSMNIKTTISPAAEIDLVMEPKANYNNKVPQVVTIDSHNQDNIVLVPQKLKAGYLQGYNDPKFISKLPTFRMPGLNNGVFRMFPVEGVSMFPTLVSGYVVGEFVDDWINGIKDNRVYAVISNEVEDGLIKRCINRIDKYNNLICKSDNRRNYPTQNINPSSIKEIWEIKLHLNFDLPDPGDLYDRMNDLEAEMQEMKRNLIK